jgi:O-antigen/teichoic acid export membrane protein
LLLHFWGKYLYGDWIVMSALPSYLSMGDLGFVAATCNEMAALVATGDWQSARRVFQTTTFLVAFVALLGISAAVVLTHSTPAIHLLKLSQAAQGDVALIVSLFSTYVVLVTVTNVLYAGFFCNGKYALGTSLTAAIRLFEFFLLTIAVCRRGSPVAAVISLVAGRTIGNIGIYTILRHATPLLGTGIGLPDTSAIRRLLPSALAFALFPVGNALNLQGMVVVLGTTLGSSTVAVFSTIRTLTRFPSQIVNSINGIVQPEIASAFGRGNTPLIRQIHRVSFQITLWLSVFAALALSALGGIILHVWTRGRIPLDRPLLIVLLAASAVNMLWQSSLMTAYATSRHKRMAARYALINSLVLTALVGLGRSSNTRSAGALLLGGELGMAIGVIPFALKLTHDRASDFVVEVVRPPHWLPTLQK